MHARRTRRRAPGNPGRRCASARAARRRGYGRQGAPAWHPAPRPVVGQDMADERVPVAVQTRRAERDERVARLDPVGTEYAVGVHHADPGAGDVVLVGPHHARMLRGLAADERAAGLHASLGDAATRWSRSSPVPPCRWRCSRRERAARRRRPRGRRRPWRPNRCRSCRAGRRLARLRAWCQPRPWNTRGRAADIGRDRAGTVRRTRRVRVSNSGRLGAFDRALISSTARSPASMSTPAAA